MVKLNNKLRKAGIVETTFWVAEKTSIDSNIVSSIHRVL